MTTRGYPTLGDRVGAYLIRRRIGIGGMGMVFAATHEGLDRDVALKVIAPHLADDEGFRARFTREARALATLDSPHVVHVYDHGEHDGHLYIATQLVPDGDLGTMLQARGAPPVRTAVDLIAQVATGLSDAHDAGIIHRDIKPANVLVREGGGRITAYLGDFGIARQVGAEHTTTSRTIGTPSYMAPELHTGGTPTDVYSLGCLLWATLTGKAPYAGTSDYQIMHAHLEEPVPQLIGTGPLLEGVNRILRTAMAKEPAERPVTSAALRDDLRSVLELPTAPAEEVPGTSTSPPSAGGRRRTPLVVTAAASASETASASAADEQKAVETLTTALVGQGLASEVAACAAQGWVDAVGVNRLVEAGVLTEDLEENTEDLGGSPDSEVLTAGTTATAACLAR